MSDRKLFGLFSGLHLTIMTCVAIVVPGALYGAVTFSPVSIVDSGSGFHAAVDSGRRLFTYDPVAGYTNNPQNILNGSYFYYGNQTVNVYTVPTGKALILKTVNMSYNSGTANYDNSVRFNRLVGSNGYYITGFEDTNILGTHYSDLGPGFILYSGEKLQLITTVPVNFSLMGVLVPTTAVVAQ